MVVGHEKMRVVGLAESERGAALLIAVFVMLIVSTIGSALLVGGMTDLVVSDSYRSQMVAFHAADYGIEQAKIDFATNSADFTSLFDMTTPVLRLQRPFPTQVVMGGHTIDLDVDGQGEVVPGYYDFGPSVYTSPGAYSRAVLFPARFSLGFSGGIIGRLAFTIRSTGTFGTTEAATQVIRSDLVVMLRPISEIWDNAIFAGGGIMGGGYAVQGNAQIRGSLYVNGDQFDPPRVRWTGTSFIWNHYREIESNQNFDEYAWKIPDPPTTEYNGQEVDTLGSVVRMKYADLELMGNVEWGEGDDETNPVKDTLDGFYLDGTVNDPDKIHADESGFQEDAIDFPSIYDPYDEDGDGNADWATYKEYLEDRSLLIPETHIGDLTASFEHGAPGGNHIKWDQPTGELTIEGLVRVVGDLELGFREDDVINPQDAYISYTGTGTIFADGDLTLIGDIMPKGHYLLERDVNGELVASDQNLGLISSQAINVPISWTNPVTDELITLSHLKVMAALFGEEMITLQKQDRFAGAFVTKNIDLGNQVPRVFQVPWLAGMLPPGLPGSGEMTLEVESIDLTGWFRQR